MDFSFLLEYESINVIAVTLGVAANLGLLLVAIRALGQIEVQRGQVALTKQMAAIAELRNFETFINKAAEVEKKMRDRRGNKSRIAHCEMDDFTLSECDNQNFKSIFTEWHEFFNGNMDLFSEAIACANSLEVIAASLRYGIADMEVIKSAIGSVFCEFVESNSYVYASKRTEAKMLYVNTIFIYKVLKPDVHTLSVQKASLSQQMRKVFG